MDVNIASRMNDNSMIRVGWGHRRTGTARTLPAKEGDPGQEAIPMLVGSVFNVATMMPIDPTGIDGTDPEFGPLGYCINRTRLDLELGAELDDGEKIYYVELGVGDNDLEIQVLVLPDAKEGILTGQMVVIGTTDWRLIQGYTLLGGFPFEHVIGRAMDEPRVYKTIDEVDFYAVWVRA